MYNEIASPKNQKMIEIISPELIGNSKYSFRVPTFAPPKML